MSRCAICGKKVFEGGYRDYEDPERGKILFICKDHELPKSSPPPVDMGVEEEERKLVRPPPRSKDGTTELSR